MKKLFVLSVLICTCIVQALAYEWTDANGVMWTFSQQSYYYDNDGDGVSTYQTYYTITGVSNYGDEVTVPETVYDGETPYAIEAIGSGVFQNNLTLSKVTLPTTLIIQKLL